MNKALSIGVYYDTGLIDCVKNAQGLGPVKQLAKPSLTM